MNQGNQPMGPMSVSSNVNVPVVSSRNAATPGSSKQTYRYFRFYHLG